MYLFSANPWLAKMMQVTIALYGAGEVEVDNKTRELLKSQAPEAPEKVNIELKQCYFPSRKRRNSFYLLVGDDLKIPLQQCPS